MKTKSSIPQLKNVIKIKTFIWQLILCLVVVSACKKETVKDNIPGEKAEVKITEAMLIYLKNNGFDTTNVIVKDNTVFIENDIAISIKDLTERVKKKADTGYTIKQRKSAFQVNSDRINGIGIYVSPSVPTTWKDAVMNAIVKYQQNSTYNVISLIQIYDEDDADIKVDYYYDPTTSIAAWAYLPTSDEKPGSEIWVNSYYNSITDAKKLFTMIHELGHTIGFEHTNQTVGSLITGTPTIDANSFMNSTILSWSNFTYYDGVAMTNLYPLPLVPSQSPKIFGPGTIDLSSGPYLVAFIFSQEGEGSGTYQWEIVGTLYGDSVDRTQETDPSVLGTGNYTIKARALVNGTYTPWASKDFVIVP